MKVPATLNGKQVLVSYDPGSRALEVTSPRGFRFHVQAKLKPAQNGLILKGDELTWGRHRMFLDGTDASRAAASRLVLAAGGVNLTEDEQLATRRAAQDAGEEQPVSRSGGWFVAVAAVLLLLGTLIGIAVSGDDSSGSRPPATDATPDGELHAVAVTCTDGRPAYSCQVTMSNGTVRAPLLYGPFVGEVVSVATWYEYGGNIVCGNLYSNGAFKTSYQC